MPKIRTHKATSKRFKITKNNKVMRRKAGQDHYNSKESGNTTRMKRRDVVITKGTLKNIKKLLGK